MLCRGVGLKRFGTERPLMRAKGLGGAIDPFKGVSGKRRTKENRTSNLGDSAVDFPATF